MDAGVLPGLGERVPSGCLSSCLINENGVGARLPPVLTCKVFPAEI